MLVVATDEQNEGRKFQAKARIEELTAETSNMEGHMPTLGGREKAIKGQKDSQYADQTVSIPNVCADCEYSDVKVHT